MSGVDADELFGANDLPYDLVLVQVIKEYRRVPDFIDSITFVFFIIIIIILAVEFFLEEGCEDKRLANPVHVEGIHYALTNAGGHVVRGCCFVHNRIDYCGIRQLLLLVVAGSVKV